MKKKKVLVIDDDQDTLDILKHGLNSNGFEVHTAESGTLGLKKVQAKSPDLILMDILMPDMDGFKVMEKTKKIVGAENIPIIIVSGNSNTETIINAIKKGASDYMVKPVDIEILKKKIEKTINSAHAASRASHEKFDWE